MLLVLDISLYFLALETFHPHWIKVFELIHGYLPNQNGRCFWMIFFYFKKFFVDWFQSNWSQRIQSTSQHWSRKWLGAKPLPEPKMTHLTDTRPRSNISSPSHGGGWGCEVSCGGHHRPRGKTTTGSALDGAVFDIAQILAYLVHNMRRSQLYLGFGHFGWLPSFFSQ